MFFEWVFSIHIFLSYVNWKLLCPKFVATCLRQWIQLTFWILCWIICMELFVRPDFDPVLVLVKNVFFCKSSVLWFLNVVHLFLLYTLEVVVGVLIIYWLLLDKWWDAGIMCQSSRIHHNYLGSLGLINLLLRFCFGGCWFCPLGFVIVGWQFYLAGYYQRQIDERGIGVFGASNWWM